MGERTTGRVPAGLAGFAAIVAASLGHPTPIAAQAVTVAPSTLPRLGTVDERFQSYNLEMVEVTGGRFWAPYPKPGEAPAAEVAGPTGGNFVSTSYRQRQPIELKANRRLRVLTKALGPAYVRMSGTWANATYFHDADTRPPAVAPQGFEGILTRQQWAGVVDFAKAVDARIVTSFATSAGARDPSGAWSPEQARRLVDFTRSLGGSIYAVELTNEPNASRYKPADFARDTAVMRSFLKTHAPEIKTVGPGTTGEAGFRAGMVIPKELTTEALMSAAPRPQFDIFDYHFYGATSKRCERLGKDALTAPDRALSEDWLARADQSHAFYSALRDRFAPQAPIWITEIAQAACGGDAWAATFIDSFRYVDHLGRLAKRGVAAVFHNTLAASDYALIDEETWTPRPNYWAALLWRRLMGEVVLDAGPLRPGLHVYAHCLRGRPGGVALAAINLDRTTSAALQLPRAAETYALTADALEATGVKLNGRLLELTSGDALPRLKPRPVAKGKVTLAPASITFLAIPSAANSACR